MKVFAAIAAVASANVVPGGDNNPCPSDCWDWNASDATCKIKAGAVNGVLAGCFAVTCNFGTMEVDVLPKLFGLDGNDTVFANGATYDAGLFKYDEPLGDSTRKFQSSTTRLTLLSTLSLEWDLFHLEIAALSMSSLLQFHLRLPLHASTIQLSKLHLKT